MGAPCANNYAFTAYSAGSIIVTTPVSQLRTAVTEEYTRRSLGTPSFTTTLAQNNFIYNSNLQECRDRINTIGATTWTNAIGVASIIYWAATSETQTRINALRNECLCNCNYCSCNCNDCGCCCCG